MESSGHRANILNRRFRHIGIGVALGAPEASRRAARSDLHDGLRHAHPRTR